MTQALFFILDTVLFLFSGAVLLRFLAQWLSADYRNPVSQAIVQITDPVLAPLRKVLPQIGGQDTAAIVVIILLMIGKVFLYAQFRGVAVTAPAISVMSLYFIGELVFKTFIYLIIAEVILSWISPTPYHPARLFINALTAPLMAPLRRLIKPIGGTIDIVPMIVLILLYAGQIAFGQLLLGG
ncbi:MAG: YggT family protein [Pseudomonadota bacterium]